MNQNDKIVELIKAVLNGKTVQYSNFGATWGESDLQKEQNFLGLIDSIVLRSYNYRIKPETKKIIVRNWLSKGGRLVTWTAGYINQEEIEKLNDFKQWLDPEPRVYEVDV